MDIPHTIIWRSVVLQTIPKPEINRPKLVKLLLSTKYIESIYEFYATEHNVGLREAFLCRMYVAKHLTYSMVYKRK